MAGKASSLPAIIFDDDEFDIVLEGLVTLSRLADLDAARAEAADALLGRLEAMLPDPPVGPTPKPLKKDGPHHCLVREAIRTETRLRLKYLDKKGTSTQRTVWPLELGAFSVEDTFAAWCEARQDFRHFRLNRIESLEATGKRFPTRRRILLARLRVAAMDQYH